jgi:hypothetical protein
MHVRDAPTGHTGLHVLRARPAARGRHVRLLAASCAQPAATARLAQKKRKKEEKKERKKRKERNKEENTCMGLHRIAGCTAKPSRLQRLQAWPVVAWPAAAGFGCCPATCFVPTGSKK